MTFYNGVFYSGGRDAFLLPEELRNEMRPPGPPPPPRREMIIQEEIPMILDRTLDRVAKLEMQMENLLGSQRQMILSQGSLIAAVREMLEAIEEMTKGE